MPLAPPPSEDTIPRILPGPAEPEAKKEAPAPAPPLAPPAPKPAPSKPAAAPAVQVGRAGIWGERTCGAVHGEEEVGSWMPVRVE